MPAPHGGKLIYRVNKNKNIEGMDSIEVSNEIAHDIENIAFGIFSPLEGFMCNEDFEYVLYHMRLSNDLPWTIPIVFDLKGKEFKEGDEVLLKAKNGVMAIFSIEEIYTYDKKEYAEKVFKKIVSTLSRYGAITPIEIGEKVQTYAIREDVGPVVGALSLIHI